jgi:hypothetical protein
MTERLFRCFYSQSTTPPIAIIITAPTPTPIPTSTFTFVQSLLSGPIGVVGAVGTLLFDPFMTGLKVANDPSVSVVTSVIIQLSAAAKV